MITVSLIGRAGNQLFQMATAMDLALRAGVELVIPQQTENPNAWPMYFPELAGDGRERKANLLTYEERSFNFHAIPTCDNIRLRGYFQTEKYFYSQWPVIRRALFRDYGFDEPKKNYKFISLHVRRGDYLQYFDLHPPMSLTYYQQAIDYFKYLEPEYKFLVFSDDIPWCKRQFVGDQFRFSEGRTPKEDIVAMSKCTHHIIANSTFSWWGAYLNPDEDKIVISPRREDWFAGKNLRHDTSDLLPKEWIQMPQQ